MKLLFSLFLVGSSAMAQSLFFFKTEKSILQADQNSKDLFKIEDQNSQRQPQSVVDSNQSEKELRDYMNKMFQKKKKGSRK